MKILFATDGSASALTALESLLRHEDWFAARPDITLVHVHPPIPYGMAARVVGKRTVEEHYAEESSAALAPCRQALDRRGILYDAHALVGDPAEQIVSYARDHRYDCIALGVHGHNALASLMLGSVAQKVGADAAVPVLLLK